jgi:nonribosomal peptide synthetase DhbF
MQASGLGSADVRPSTEDEIADDYLARIRIIQSEGPYTLLGWSFGGNVAHRIAARLQESGERVDHLVLLDSLPGGHEHHRTDWTPLELRELALGGVLAELGEADLEALVRVTENSARILESSSPLVFNGDVHFFEATQEDKPGGPYSESWRSYANGQIVCEPVPARHLDMLGPEAMSVVGPLVATLLESAIVRAGKSTSDT